MKRTEKAPGARTLIPSAVLEAEDEPKGGLPARFEPRSVSSPAETYLLSLSGSSRRTQRNALSDLCCILRGVPLARESKHAREEAVAALRVFPWWDLHYDHTVALRARLVDEIEEETWGPATVNRMLAAFRRVLKECFRLSLMGGDAFMRASDIKDVPAERLPAGRVLDIEEIRALFKAARNEDDERRRERDTALLALLRYGGFRRHEAVGALVKNYTKDGVVTIIGKRNKQREVPLGPEKKRVDAWLKIRPEGGANILTHFDSPKPLTPEAVFSILRHLAKKADLDPASFSAHDFRRTFITEQLESGTDVLIVQKLVGHDDPKTTARYDRRGLKAMIEAANKTRV